ncbi:S41 family peptidase [Patescibacteria group bacterium]|nr:S41 family peptidase [Patescibacteria group bacterium]
MSALKTLQKFYTVLFVLLLSVGLFTGGYYFGRRGFDIAYQKTPPVVRVINKDNGPKDVDFAQFWEVWDLINKEHIDRPFDPRKLMYGALKGLTSAVGDPYTSFLVPVENESLSSSLNGEYEGIGAELGMKDNQLIIVAPLDGSPAQKLGVRSGDKIIKIDEKDTVGITITEAVSKIRGPKGQGVTLTLRRGEDEFNLTILRDKIVIKSVVWEDKGDGVVYIRLSRFGEKTPQEWNEVISDMLPKMPNLKSIILDLRGNPGGFLTGSVYVASEFIEKGVVVKQVMADGTATSLDMDRRGKLLKYPVVVLIDQGSASASEILTLALQDYGRAVTVGAKSFGKGTVQDARDFKDGSGVHVTVAKWLSPKGIWVHKVGITPDYSVEITEEDVKNFSDPQLEKAVELAKGGGAKL